MSGLPSTGDVGGGVQVIAPTTPDDTLLAVIAKAASDPGTDVDKLERLMGLYERMQATEAHRQYTAALAELQPELPVIEEHGEILDRAGAVQSTYALWEDINEQIKPILARHGFSLTFAIGHDENRISVTGKLSHRAGHVEETTFTLPLDTSGNKNTVQAYGSSVSYGKRYTASALLNLTSRGVDDDGQAAGTALITDGEQEALRLLAEKAGVNIDRFCAHLKIASLDQLPRRRLRIAERLLQDRLAKDQPNERREPVSQREPPTVREPMHQREPTTSREPNQRRGKPGELLDYDYDGKTP